MSIKRILIAEDNENLAAIYKKFLTHHKYEVEVVGNANETLERLHYDSNFDLLITDLDMPRWDASYSIIGSNAAFKNLKIIIISGHLDNPLYKFISSITDNVVAAFNKPVDFEILLDTVKKII